MKKSMLVAALVFAVAASSVMAGWQYVQFPSGNDVVRYRVSTKVGQDAFTIYKEVSSYRLYITIQGVGYEEFKSSVVKWNTGARQAPADSELGWGAMTCATLTDGSMFDANGNFKFEIYLPDRFAGRNPKLSVVLMPHPASNAHSGGSPALAVTAANCSIAGVKAVYTPRPVDASGSQLAPNGTVSVTTGTADSQYYTYNYGNVGTIDVLGGLFGTVKIRGNCVTLLSQARTCTIKPGGTKQKVLQGGSMGDTEIFVGGRIGTVSARNGLVGAGGKDAKKRIVSGYVDSANPKMYSTPADIRQIVVKRGWDKPCVVAGSEYNANYESTAPTFYNGNIGLFRVNNKGDGTCSGQTGGCFTSDYAPRVTGKMKSSVSGNTIYVQRMGKCDLADFAK